MSKLQAEIIKATGLKVTKGEARPAFIDRLLVATHKLDDAGWDSLSKEAQDWFNDATDVKNANIKNPKAAKAVPDFPDLEQEEDEPKPRGRRRAAEEEQQQVPAELEVGVEVEVVTSRGKEFAGEVIELSDDDIVVKVGDEELEFSRGKLESITVTTLVAAGETDDGPAGPKEPEQGDTVTLVTTRNKEYTGEVVEISDDDIVVKVGAEELEFSRSKLKSVVVAAAEAAQEEDEPKPRGRRGAAAKDDGKDAGKDEDAKPKRSSNPKGVSVGGRIRELMAEDTNITQEDVSKTLKKEGLEFRDTSLGMIYKDTKAFLDLLKAAKKLK